MQSSPVRVEGVVVQGHHVASQASEHYPRGTIEMQLPFFRERGLDLSPYYQGTINILIEPHTFSMKYPQFTFFNVHWTDAHPPEHFSFSSCRLEYAGQLFKAWIYYPHPETKKRHFQNPSLVEVIAKHIPGLQYADTVILEVNQDEVEIDFSGCIQSGGEQ
ncbi:MAG: hypothetical protein JXA13_14370 [Anaerolineales bacterium]|nr:hypothetical protein [Anaerolineales bacterium]